MPVCVVISPPPRTLASWAICHANHTFFYLAVRRGGEATLTWTDPSGEEIEEDSELYRLKPIDELSKGLEITLSDPAMDGTFTCTAQFESGRTATAQIKIRAIKKPTFVTKPDPVKEVNEGTRVEFNCLTTGIPLPVVKWKFANQDIRSTGDGRISVGNGVLVIQKTQPSDAGVYTCEASIEERNEVASTNVTLNIKFRPRIVFPAGESLVTQIGAPTQCNFTILAYPPPSVSVVWKGKDFKGDDIKQVAQDGVKYTFSFQFTPESAEDISGLHIKAVNDAGSEDKTLALQEETPDKGLGIGSILAIVLLILLLVLMVVDVTCYYKCRRGLLMCCRASLLGKSACGAGVESPGKPLSKAGKSTVVNVSGIEA
ncbi:hemicentin-2-like [Varanus komodoensis]|uniref:hemicentin-2-like n=1 Tax=Varanus komodoensis TaxID=61221 RepID=UPI001CF7740A|nr:hemicentin-2-like [Varanus komodoensis]